MSALEGIRERAAAATEGPWEVSECSPCTDRGRLDVSIWANDGNTPIADWCDGDEFSRTDAEFIAHARTDIPRLLDALDAVLALHVPYGEGCEWPGESGECSGCRTDEDMCCGSHEWPCPTVRAVNDALEAGE